MGMIHYARHGSRRRLIAGDMPNWVRNSKRRDYIAQVLLSLPPWQDIAELKRIGERCACISEMTGVAHHVSHIVPLTHPRVCGLTVPWNLEIKPARVNMSESNRFNIADEQLELFQDKDAPVPVGK